MSETALILASGSSSRRAMLAAADVTFSVVMPDVDEDEIRAGLEDGAAAQNAMAEHLASHKALAVSRQHPEALVLGGDQVLICGGRDFHKATDASGAERTLRALRGRTHDLVSAAALAKAGEIVWRCKDIARLEMRAFSDEFLRKYLTAEIPEILGSVGCYRIEGRGAQLFARIEGDQFTIRGLPLIHVLAALRTHGALPS